MVPHELTTVVTAVVLPLVAAANVGGQQDVPGSAGRQVVLQGCVVAAGGAPTADRTSGSAPTFILETAPDAGQNLDRSVKPYGQSGHPTAQRQTPTGQQTQAGQEPMGPVGDDATTGTGWRKYRLAIANGGERFATYVGHEVEVRGHVTKERAVHRRHDGQPDRQGIVDPLTGMPGPRDQAGPPAPHYSSPDVNDDVSGTLTIMSMRVLSASCTRER